MHKTWLIVGLVAASLWCLTVVASEGNHHHASGKLTTVASLDALMTGQLQHFKNINQLVADKSAEKRTSRLQMQAEILAELANVNTLHGEKDDYRAWAAQLRDTSLELASLAKKGSLDDAAAGALIQQMKNSCQSCHDEYR